MRLYARIKTIAEQPDREALPLFLKWMKEATRLYVYEVETDGRGEILSLRLGELLPESNVYSSEFRKRFTYDFAVTENNVELFLGTNEHRLKDGAQIGFVKNLSRR